MKLLIAFIEVFAVSFFSIIAYLTFNNPDFPICIVCIFAVFYFLHNILLGIKNDLEEKEDERNEEHRSIFKIGGCNNVKTVKQGVSFTEL